MSSEKIILSCIRLFLCTILINFCAVSSAEVDENIDRGTEERIHNIFVKHYSEPILDNDWFKMVDNIENQDYQVKPGDTLWGISKIYFGDGFYWSKLWSVNQGITNPHRIEVSDTVHFKAGSFSSEPSISVEEGTEQGENVDVVEEATASPRRRGSVKTYALEPANKIPDSFKEYAPMIPQKPKPITIVERPPMVYQNTAKLTQEISKTKPNVVGYVKSVGTDRIITGEVNMFVMESSQVLTPGSTVTVLDPDFGNLKSGYFVRVLGVAKVIKSLGSDLFGKELYEMVTDQQFDAFKIGCPISTYALQMMDLEIEGDPLDIPVTIVKSNTKTIWANGDIIFLQSSQKNLSVGDLVNINNRFSQDVNFYYHTGLLKIVSISPPYATGVVLYANTAILNDAVSTP